MRKKNTSNTCLEKVIEQWPTIYQSIKFYRPNWVEINTANFKNNIKNISSFINPKTKIMAVIKANAYGHLSVPLAKIAVKAGVVSLGVATIEEGIALRQNGIKDPILILGSIYPLENLSVAVKNNLIPTICSNQGLDELVRLAKKINKRLPFQINVDTGMGRVGISPESVINILEKVKSIKEISLSGLYTHFSCAGTDFEFTKNQIKRFDFCIKSAINIQKNLIVHASNSAGIINFPEANYNLVRPGLILYGLLPAGVSKDKIDILPVLSWKTKIVFLKKVPEDTPISYGKTFVTKRQSLIATLPVGYADGYMRCLSNISQVLIREKRCQVVGRVTMDMIMVDVTDVPEVSVGDEVVLIGSQGNQKITAEEMARWANTINYEITCNISYRVPRKLI